jgi:hypothetical protein
MRDQRDELDTTIVQQGIRIHQKSIDPLLLHALKGCIDVASSGRRQNLNLSPDGCRRGLYIFDRRLRDCRTVWIDQHRKTRGIR